jgi:hypothetical protein
MGDGQRAPRRSLSVHVADLSCRCLMMRRAIWQNVGGIRRRFAQGFARQAPMGFSRSYSIARAAASWRVETTSRTSSPPINYGGESSHYGAGFLESAQTVGDGPISCGAKGWHTKCSEIGEARHSGSAQRLRRDCITKPEGDTDKSNALTESRADNQLETDRGLRP